jgi:hypothetical protein
VFKTHITAATPSPPVSGQSGVWTGVLIIGN